jgi:hypothetical protein
VNKQKGTAYEYRFFSNILDRGYQLFIPAGDALPVDCVVQNGAGKFFKVQIKGTACPETSNRVMPRYKVLAGSGKKSKKMSIDCAKVDILAAYVDPVDAWYIIPCLELNGKLSTWFYPHSERSTARFEKFRENWGLFKTV